MKRNTSVVITLSVLGSLIIMASNALAGPPKAALSSSAPKGGQSRGELPVLDLSIGFSDSSGQTVTDENGTMFNFFGISRFEPKVYPPEYWGVFPLYFFGDAVGVTVDVINQSADIAADVRLSAECYCLKTTGENGAQLLAPIPLTFRRRSESYGGQADL